MRLETARRVEEGGAARYVPYMHSVFALTYEAARCTIPTFSRLPLEPQPA